MQETRYLLRDGTAVLVRPIRAEDKAELQDGLQQLSPRSRRLRFVMAPDHLSEKDLIYLTEVDQVNHIALVVTDASHPARGIAVARSIRSPDNPRVAEPAITVVDAYQGRGLGTLLLGLLSREAYAKGVRHFRAFVLATNTPMIKILEQVGATVARAEGGSRWYDIPLSSSPQDLPDMPAGNALRALLGNAARG